MDTIVILFSPATQQPGATNTSRYTYRINNYTWWALIVFTFIVLMYLESLLYLAGTTTLHRWPPTTPRSSQDHTTATHCLLTSRRKYRTTPFTPASAACIRPTSAAILTELFYDRGLLSLYGSTINTCTCFNFHNYIRNKVYYYIYFGLQHIWDTSWRLAITSTLFIELNTQLIFKLDFDGNKDWGLISCNIMIRIVS